MTPKTYSITPVEKQVLFNKYLSQGFSYEESNEKVENTTKHLKSFSEVLKTKNLTPSEIDRRFKQEFYKICEELDK